MNIKQCEGFFNEWYNFYNFVNLYFEISFLKFSPCFYSKSSFFLSLFVVDKHFYLVQGSMCSEQAVLDWVIFAYAWTVWRIRPKSKHKAHSCLMCTYVCSLRDSFIQHSLCWRFVGPVVWGQWSFKVFRAFQSFTFHIRNPWFTMEFSLLSPSFPFFLYSLPIASIRPSHLNFLLGSTEFWIIGCCHGFLVGLSVSQQAPLGSSWNHSFEVNFFCFFFNPIWKILSGPSLGF